MKEHEKSFQILFAEFIDLILISIHATKAMVITRPRNRLDEIEFHAPSTKVEAETSWKIVDTIEGINFSTVLENCNVRKVKTDILAVVKRNNTES